MRRKHLLVIDRGVPTFDQDSGSLRMYSILALLAVLNYHVIFFPADQNPRKSYTDALKKLGIQVLFQDLPDYLKSKGNLFSYVLLSRPDETFKYLPYVRNYAVNSKIIYDTVDIHWVRCQRGAQLYGEQNFQEQANYFRTIEKINATCSDLTLTVTEEDKNFLLEEIFPIIQEKIPGIQFHVVGSHPPPSITALKSSDINVTGFVKDVRPHFEELLARHHKTKTGGSFRFS